MTSNGPRPGHEAAPWRDPYGFVTRREKLRQEDANDGWRNFKRSMVTVADDSLLESVETTYVVETVRNDGWKGEGGIITAFVEFVDPMGQAQRVILPGAVIERVMAHREALNAENASRKAKAVAEERQARKQAKGGAS